MIWKPGDCYTMTVPLHTAGLLLPKCRVDAGLGAGRQPDWILDRISGKNIVNVGRRRCHRVNFNLYGDLL